VRLSLIAIIAARTCALKRRIGVLREIDADSREALPCRRARRRCRPRCIPGLASIPQSSTTPVDQLAPPTSSSLSGSPGSRLAGHIVFRRSNSSTPAEAAALCVPRRCSFSNPRVRTSLLRRPRATDRALTGLRQILIDPATTVISSRHETATDRATLIGSNGVPEKEPRR
jgi:hypothetical protein